MQLDYCILSVVEMEIYKKVRYTYDKTNHKKNFNTLYGTVCFYDNNMQSDKCKSSK